MSKVDFTIENINAEMIFAKKTIQKEIPLPEGYEYVPFSNQYQDKISALYKELNININLDEKIQSQREIFKNHCLLVTLKNELVGFLCLLKDESQCLYLACTAVKEGHQHKGIGKAMISKCCMNFDRIKGKYPLYAKVNAQAYNEIKLLSKMEFTPFLGQTSTKSEEESVQDWERITKILKEKQV